MTIHIGFSVTKAVNGETVPDYTAEKTNNNTTIGKMINATIELLKRHKVKGVGDVVGTYDYDILGEACHKIFNGATHINVYGIGINDQYFQVAKIL